MFLNDFGFLKTEIRHCVFSEMNERLASHTFGNLQWVLSDSRSPLMWHFRKLANGMVAVANATSSEAPERVPSPPPTPPTTPVSSAAPTSVFTDSNSWNSKSCLSGVCQKEVLGSMLFSFYSGMHFGRFLQTLLEIGFSAQDAGGCC